MNTKIAIATDKAPIPIGPYSQAVSAAGLIFLSCQIPVDPKTGIIMTGDIQQQTRRVMKNMEEVLRAGGSSFDLVIKTTIYLKDVKDYPHVNEIYAQYFHGALPARVCIEVSRMPKDARIAIDAIALVE